MNVNYINGSSVSDSFVKKSSADLMSRFPSMADKVAEIRIGSEAKFQIPAVVRNNGIVGAQCDSAPRSYWNMSKQYPYHPLVRVEPDPKVVEYTAKSVDSMISGGKTIAEAKAAFAQKVEPVVTWDEKEGQFVVRPHIAGVNDSIITNTSIPYWATGFLYKIFKQPYTASKASRLVSTESFGNAWCEVCMCFKEAFEGYGRISNTARGNVEQTNNNPVLNRFGQIMSQVYNIAIDYESSITEMIAGQNNPLTAIGIADREKYADMVLARIKDQLIYFGDTESGFNGLSQSCTPVTYSGTPLNSILTGSSTTKGHDIAQAYITWIANFMQDNHYLANEIKINVSTYVYKALQSAMYSDQYNPSSPMEVIQAHFNKGEDLGGGLKKLAVSFEVDTMLDPTISGGNQNPFNTNAYDLMFVTVPSVNSAMGEQQGLVILPEPLATFIVPPILSRQGTLYTMYKRIGDIIAPVAGTVACVHGFGYQG